MRGKVILTRSKTHGWVEVERKRVDESLRKVAESRIWTVVEGRHIELNAILKSSCYEEGLGEVAYASLHKPTEAYRNLCHYALIIGNEDPPDTIRSWSKRRYISVWNLWISSLALLLRDYSPTDLMLVSVANDFYAGLHSGASSTWLKLVSRWRTWSPTSLTSCKFDLAGYNEREENVRTRAGRWQLSMMASSGSNSGTCPLHRKNASTGGV